MNSVIATIFPVSTVSRSRVTRAGDYAYRVSHHVPTGMPGMAPNVFLCRALYQRKYSPSHLGSSIVRVMCSLSRAPIWLSIMVRAYFRRNQTGQPCLRLSLIVGWRLPCMSRTTAEAELWHFGTCSFCRARVTIRRGWHARFWVRAPFNWDTFAPRSFPCRLLGWGSGGIFFIDSAHQIIEQFPIPSNLFLTFNFEFSRHIC
jgi:hypothetical protein